MLQGHTMAIVPCGNPTPKKLPTGGGEWPTFRTARAQRTVRPLTWTHLSWAHQCHPLLNWKRNQKNLSWMTRHCLGRAHHGVFRKSVEHAFCATLYASCLFFPVHLSSKRK